jgi:hypothetical protein
MKKGLGQGVCLTGLIMMATLGAKKALANGLICPAGYEGVAAESRLSEVYATSAPEKKIRTSMQKDAALWHKAVHPLIMKAIEEAKVKRAAAIEGGIENACAAKEQFVSQLIPVEGKVSSCEYRVVTRPADDEHLWVQAIANCNYESTCCRSTVAGGVSKSSVSVSLEMGTSPTNDSMVPSSSTAKSTGTSAKH